MWISRRTIIEKDNKIAELTKLVEKLTNKLIDADKHRCELMGIDYDKLGK